MQWLIAGKELCGKFGAGIKKVLWILTCEFLSAAHV